MGESGREFCAKIHLHPSTNGKTTNSTTCRTRTDTGGGVGEKEILRVKIK
jgi:hypothetical protein